MARRELIGTAEICSTNTRNRPLFQGVPVEQGTDAEQPRRTGRKAAPALGFAVPRVGGTRWNSHSVPLFRLLYKAEREEHRNKNAPNWRTGGGASNAGLRSTLEAAVDQKVEQIREFVRWWDEGVKSRGNPEKKGSDLKSADRRKLNMADAESLTGISQQQVSRWRKRIKDEAAR